MFSNSPKVEALIGAAFLVGAIYCSFQFYKVYITWLENSANFLEKYLLYQINKFDPPVETVSGFSIRPAISQQTDLTTVEAIQQTATEMRSAQLLRLQQADSINFYQPYKKTIVNDGIPVK